MKRPRWQMSESIIVGTILAFSGGYMDAYTYLYRDGVFANAQTGNLILLGTSIFDGSWYRAVEYLCPILAFAFGVFIAQFIRLHLQNCKHLHWRQLCVLAEIAIMLVVSSLNVSFNLLANSMVSLACGIQVQSFQKIHGNRLATTMCIGNLRSATEMYCNYRHTKEKKILGKSLFYYGVILIFILGAVCGKYFVTILGEKAILTSAILLLTVFIIMFIENKEERISHDSIK